ncbi:MAG: transcription termination factor NusA [Candidatus Aminicenantes bacterium]|nr:transcription termination factor NusA [Candidatus Aminicenantes bacterium]
MKIEVWPTILQLSQERGVQPQIIVEAIIESLRVASSKYFTNGEKILVDFKPEEGELRVFVIKKVVERVENKATEISLEEAQKIWSKAKIGDFLEIDLPAATLGRISAQVAKQVIFQKVHDAEQEKIYDEFAPRVGELVSGTVRRFEGQNMIVEVDKAEAIFPFKEKLPNEEFIRGDRIRAIITHVIKGSKGSQIYLSRISPRFLAKLLEIEIPEIANGLIEIKDIVRQPGERAKVAVYTSDKDIDPVGACIGPKGNRIQAISKELRGEKIDIIIWSSDPVSYARAALSPAKIENIIIVDRKEKILKALVPKDQLSLAIGKKGINVKLASRLTGWKIEINEE